MLNEMKEKEVDSLANIVFRRMQEGIIVLDPYYQILCINPWGQKVTGYKEEELQGTDFSSLFLNRNDYENMKNYLHRDGKWKGEIWKKRKSGEIYQEWMNISAVYSEAGKLINYVIVFRDLTKQKKSQSEIRLAAKVLENISEGVMVTDQNGHILSVNPAFEIVTGYHEEEVISKKPNLLQSGIHDQKFYEKMWKDIIEKGKWKGEIWNKRKNGEIYPEWLTISTIKDENGNVTNYVGVFSDITELKETEEQLHILAHHDSLTGVDNRYSLLKRLEGLLNTAQRYSQQLAVLFLDLDRFKHINDTLGHNYGDLLLKHVAERFKGLLRNKDIIARLGGDEFVIVLPNIKHPKDAAKYAEEIIHSLREPFMLEQYEAYISTSIGISLYPFDGKNVKNLLKNADKAMYKAKERGKNQFEFYHEEMHSNQTVKMKMENYLRKALDRNEFFLEYQPQVETSTGEISGVEALLRWNQPEFGRVSPSDFIPLAEDTGLIVPISEWVIETAFEEIRQLHVNGFPNLKVSINISAQHFALDKFLSTIEKMIQASNINPYCVELELTERVIMPNAPETIKILVKLKQLGIKLSVDDFGTGYSSLSYLNKFPIDKLKIDQSFIKNIHQFKEDSSIVKAIITIGKQLQMITVAEGVENQKQFDFLLKEGCDQVQGFYITKPLRFEQLKKFLAEWNSQLL
ncbi:GGDEF and EAL domain-containing protein [Bacillus methanolicus]|uniref:Diguanylate cyclase/phosphodiesterase with PAS/PAC sensor(S) n=1 Tax=Bacillus methanolicus (strain MGA3 / ATCC 53907) TaxID=796606 RepID=I3E9S7_BACMM|nr:GGDEF and EAL domain-containing protein [Bacillus methanolicus]AIE60495.1 diguanylate cyclase/phosphodiesterase with PAS/PAC sensor(s) [Bacillus methanolicus MGA3]EIJ83248.1 diguanylate cyclase/phosphodiesterase with PAS/PAC sensor(s) [Bacillus methanolicus MGA3]